VQATGAAAASMAAVFEGLEVDTERMRRNLEATHGAGLAERAVMMLAPLLGRDAASDLARRALERSRETNQPFGTALAGIREASKAISAQDLRAIDRPEEYLGAAEMLRRQLLDER
jgi:3-carboxy-cis,cis-muconate cycloisomerase